MKKMSTKTTEIIQENERLTAQVKKVKQQNSLLLMSEAELAKKNAMNQKVIRMLLDKLKANDIIMDEINSLNERLETQKETEDLLTKKNEDIEILQDEIEQLQKGEKLLRNNIERSDDVIRNLEDLVADLVEACLMKLPEDIINQLDLPPTQ